VDPVPVEGQVALEDGGHELDQLIVLEEVLLGVVGHFTAGGPSAARALRALRCSDAPKPRRPARALSRSASLAPGGPSSARALRALRASDAPRPRRPARALSRSASLAPGGPSSARALRALRASAAPRPRRPRRALPRSASLAPGGLSSPRALRALRASAAPSTPARLPPALARSASYSLREARYLLLLELEHVPETRAPAALREAALGEPLEVLLGLLHLEGQRDTRALRDVLLLQALAGEDDERLQHLGRIAGAEDEVLGLVEVVVDQLALLGEVIDHPLEMLHPVAHVPRLVLHNQAKELLVALGRRDVLAEAEEGQHHALGLEVEGERRLGEAVGVAQELQVELVVRARAHQAPPGREGALAEDLGMTRLVHRLGGDEVLHFEEVGVETSHPLGRDVGRDHFDLGQEGEELRVGLADVLRQLGPLQLRPRDVRGGVPLPGHRLLVVALDVVGPHLALAADLRLQVRETGRLGRAARREAPVLADQLG